MTTPAGIVKIITKAAAPPPVESSLTYRIGQNATHAEITEIVTMLPTRLGRSTGFRTRAGEYALLRHQLSRGSLTDEMTICRLAELEMRVILWMQLNNT